MAALDDVDWAQTSCSFGAATQLGEELRRCASADVVIAREAVAYVIHAIAEGGQLYPATPLALPFVLELLGREDIAVRPELRELVDRIATSVEEATHHAVLSRIARRIAMRAVPEFMRADLERAAAQHVAAAKACRAVLATARR